MGEYEFTSVNPIGLDKSRGLIFDTTELPSWNDYNDIKDFISAT
jgi:hypothetical protein